MFERIGRFFSPSWNAPMFVVPSRKIPPNYRLFEIIGSDYYLNYLEGDERRDSVEEAIGTSAAGRRTTLTSPSPATPLAPSAGRRPQGVTRTPPDNRAGATLRKPRKRAAQALGGRVHRPSGESSATIRPGV